MSNNFYINSELFKYINSLINEAKRYGCRVTISQIIDKAVSHFLALTSRADFDILDYQDDLRNYFGMKFDYYYSRVPAMVKKYTIKSERTKSNLYTIYRKYCNLGYTALYVTIFFGYYKHCTTTNFKWDEVI